MKSTLKRLALHIDDFKTDFGLVFMRAQVLERCERLESELSQCSINFSVKSFPHSDFLKILSPKVRGWDVSTHSEVALVQPFLRSEHSLWLTNAKISLIDQALNLCDKVYYTLDHTSDLKASYSSDVLLGVRLDPYAFLARKHSRYGFLPDELKGLPLELKERVKFLHIHCPGEMTGKELVSLRKGLETQLSHFPKLERLNMGGGLTLKNFESFQMLCDLYAHVPMVLEPGRWFSEGAGSAFTRINAIFKKHDDLYLVGALSPEAHLKWARGLSYSVISRSKEEAFECSRLIYSSINALENDQLILSDKPQSTHHLGIGDWLVLTNIPGYSVAWNHEFNGIAQAPVYFID